MNWLFKPISSMISSVIQEAFDLLAKMTEMHAYWRDPWAQQVKGFSATFAMTLLLVKVLMLAWKLYIAREAGEAEYGPSVLVRRTFYAVAAVPVVGWAVEWLFDLANRLSMNIAQVGLQLSGWTWGGAAFESALFMNKAVQSMAATLLTQLGLKITPGPFFLFGIMLGILLVLLGMIWIQSYVRGAEMTVLFVLGPWMALSAVDQDDPLRDGPLAALCKEMVVLALTQVVQMTLAMGVIQHTLAQGPEIFTSLLPAIVLLWAAFKSPTYLRTLLHASGGGGSPALAMLMMLVRRH